VSDLDAAVREIADEMANSYFFPVVAELSIYRFQPFSGWRRVTGDPLQCGFFDEIDWCARRRGIELIGENALSSSGGRGVRLKDSTNAGMYSERIVQGANPRMADVRCDDGNRGIVVCWRPAWHRGSCGLHRQRAWRHGCPLFLPLSHSRLRASLCPSPSALWRRGGGHHLAAGLPWVGAHFHVDALAAFFLAVVNLGGRKREPLWDWLWPARA